MVRTKSILTPLRKGLRKIQRQKKRNPIARFEARLIKGFLNFPTASRQLSRVAPEPLLDRPGQLRGRRIRPFVGGIIPGIFSSVVRIKRTKKKKT